MSPTQTTAMRSEASRGAGPAVRAFARLLRAHASTTRLLSAELQEQHGLTINDYETLLARIEAGRDAMIRGLCESPLTFQAVIIWRDELNDGKVFLRDIIDLEATYAGPDAKQAPVPPPIGRSRR